MQPPIHEHAAAAAYLKSTGGLAPPADVFVQELSAPEGTDYPEPSTTIASVPSDLPVPTESHPVTSIPHADNISLGAPLPLTTILASHHPTNPTIPIPGAVQDAADDASQAAGEREVHRGVAATIENVPRMGDRTVRRLQGRESELDEETARNDEEWFRDELGGDTRGTPRALGDAGRREGPPLRTDDHS
jgi:hypothetical protein